MTDVVEVPVTGPAADVMPELASSLLSGRLVACARCSHINSMYWWHGAIQREPEVCVTMHTTTALAPAVIDRVEAVHPYDLPAVLATPVAHANAPYIDWVRRETK